MYKRKGFPEEGEIVICRVKKILSHGAVLDLEEYENKEGMIHISEISTRWVKNIRDYLKEGKTVICKVLSVDKEKGYIDLSMKRVTQREQKEKLDQWKFEKKIDKILQIVAERLGKTLDDAYKEIGNKIIKEYGALFPILEEARKKGKSALEELKIKKEWLEPFWELLEEQIKTNRVKLRGEILVSCLERDGVERIKKVLMFMKNKSKNFDIDIVYEGAPRHYFILKADNYKEGEKFLAELLKETEKFAKSLNVNFSFERLK